MQGHPPDAAAACQQGALTQSAQLLTNADDDTWQAALALLRELSQHANALQLMRQVGVLLRVDDCTEQYVSSVRTAFQWGSGVIPSSASCLGVIYLQSHVVVSTALGWLLNWSRLQALQQPTLCGGNVL